MAESKGPIEQKEGTVAAAEEKQPLKPALVENPALAPNQAPVPENKESSALVASQSPVAPDASITKAAPDAPVNPIAPVAENKEGKEDKETKEQNDDVEQRARTIQSKIDVVQHLANRTVADITFNLTRISQDLQVLGENKAKYERAMERLTQATELSGALDAEFLSLLELQEKTLSALELQPILQKTEDLIASTQLAIKGLDSYIAVKKKYIEDQQESRISASVESEEAGKGAGGPKAGGTKPKGATK